MSTDANGSENIPVAFVDKVIETGTVWALRSEEGYAVSPSNDYEEAEVIPFWSNADAAKELATDEWADYATVEVPLAEFLETWLVGMQHEELLVGADWDEGLDGNELEPLELAFAITGKLLETGKELKYEHFESTADLHAQLKSVLEEEDEDEEEEA